MDWVTVEQVAALIEQTLTPSAKVEHNVWLPVLGTSRKRQCDVVITFGDFPRQHMAIVEVQRRKRKPDINTFHGWVRKMQEVGAQELYCVSLHGYPASIIEEVATRIGPSVKLLTLKDIQDSNSFGGGSIIQLPGMIRTKQSYDFVNVSDFEVFEAETEGKIFFSTEERVFSFDGKEPTHSLNEIVTNQLTELNLSPAPPRLGRTSMPFTLEVDGTVQPLWVHQSECSFKIRKWEIQIQLVFVSHRVDMPVSNYSYRQESVNGSLAWVGCGTILFDGKEVELCTVFVRGHDGRLRASMGAKKL